MAKQLVPGVWLLELGLRRPLASNAYLVAREDVTLVDTGLFVNRPSIRRELSRAGFGPGDVDRVLLTHYDLDHVGGLRGLLPEFDGTVHMGAADVDIVEGRTAPPLFHHKGAFHRVARRLFRFPESISLQRVEDGDRIGAFTAYHTPGHNHGHTVFVHDDGLAFVGDLVWEEDGDLTTPFWLDSYDMRELRRSVRRFAAEVDDYDLLGMGHGTPLVADGAAAIDALAARL